MALQRQASMPSARFGGSTSCSATLVDASPETRPGRRNRPVACAMSWCDVGVEVRGSEPLASSVRERIGWLP
jgi:hypothetical protein